MNGGIINFITRLHLVGYFPRVNHLMLYMEIIPVCSEIHTEHINAMCGQHVELLSVKPGGIYSNRWA
jgi:hypothetical protein